MKDPDVFHQAHDALFRAAFAGDRAGVVRHRERLDRFAPALEDDDYVQHLYRQATEIADAPNPQDHALSVLKTLCPGQARSLTK